MTTDQIPKKSLFAVEEVCQIVGIKPYILRFWETEFIEITPISSSSGKKLYERKDLILITLIKQLLFDKKMTIEKAKAEIKNVELDQLVARQSNKVIKKSDEKPPSTPDRAKLDYNFIRKSSEGLHNLLSQVKLIKEQNNWV